MERNSPQKRSGISFISIMVVLIHLPSYRYSYKNRQKETAIILHDSRLILRSLLYLIQGYCLYYTKNLHLLQSVCETVKTS